MKTHFISLFIACSISCIKVFSQDSSYKEIDLSEKDFAHSVIQQSDGSFLLCGESNNSLFILKTKLSGDTLWCYKLKNTVSAGYSINYNEKNEIVAVGSILNGSLNTLVIKLDQQGNLIWKKEFGNPNIDIGYSISPASDGSFIITGQARLVNNDDSDLAYYKLDSLGNTVWSKFINWGDLDWGMSIIKTSDHNYMIAGLAAGKYLVIKINEQGDTIFSKTFNDFPNSGGASDIIEYKNNFYVLGWFGLIKLDLNGEKVLSNNIGGQKLCINDDNLFCIGWETLSPIDNYMSIFLKKLNLNGDLLIKKNFSKGKDDWGYDIIKCNNGSILFTGTSLNTTTKRHNIPLFFVNQDGYFVGLDKISKETTPDKGFKVYPNPVSGKLFVQQTSNIDEVFTLEMYSVKGELLKTECLEPGSMLHRIDTSWLRNGIYILRLISDSGKYDEKVIVKE
jgi:hypothetical protein